MVARTGSQTCPVAMLERFMAINNMSQDDQRYIFRPLQRTKNGERLREAGRISDTCLRDLFNKKVAALGFPAHELGLHSLRAGRATAAANAKVPDCLSKGTGDGSLRMLRMDMLRTAWIVCWRSPGTLGCIFFYSFLCCI